MSLTAAALSAEEYDDRKRALAELKLLTKNEQEEIYRILKATRAEFSENSNGVFFDFCTLPVETFAVVRKYLDLCRINREEFQQREEKTREAQEALLVGGAGKDVDVVYY